MTDLRVDEVRFVSASRADAATGLLGYVTFVLNGALRLDGLSLRRTLSGAVTLSYPARVDRFGHRHAFVRPISDDARRAIEVQVLAALSLDAEALGTAVTPPTAQAGSRP